MEHVSVSPESHILILKNNDTTTLFLVTFSIMTLSMMTLRITTFSVAIKTHNDI
jgi:hypothetical protein